MQLIMFANPKKISNPNDCIQMQWRLAMRIYIFASSKNQRVTYILHIYGLFGMVVKCLLCERKFQ